LQYDLNRAQTELPAAALDQHAVLAVAQAGEASLPATAQASDSCRASASRPSRHRWEPAAEEAVKRVASHLVTSQPRTGSARRIRCVSLADDGRFPAPASGNPRSEDRLPLQQQSMVGEEEMTKKVEMYLKPT
jgi:hypothetical protein